MSGYSLHIGLNAVDPGRYGGWDGRLTACEQDAHDMAAVADDNGYAQRSMLLTANATRAAVVAELRRLSAVAVAGDTVMVSYSGHGTRVPDAEGDEKDGCDEALVLFDGLLIDDELHSLLDNFGQGVRVVLISDSCHSATQARLLVADTGIPRGRIKAAPWKAALAYWSAHGMEHAASRSTPSGLFCELLQLSACRDDQTALDGDRNGAFTEALLETLPDAEDWNDLCVRIKRRCPPSQEPVLTFYDASDAFRASYPFTLPDASANC